MPFVYQGSGKKKNAKSGLDAGQQHPRCRQLACDIQWCLSRNNYKEKACQHVIDAWKDCCDWARAEAAKSAAKSKIDGA